MEFQVLAIASVTSLLVGAAPAAPAAAGPSAGPPENIEVMIGFGLWALSEALSFLPRFRANGVIQLLLSLAIRAFPYEPPQRRREPMTLTRFLRERMTRQRR